MIYVNGVTMDYRVQQENIKSIKEYLVSLVQGKVSYKEFRALDQVNVHVAPGEVCGIIGRNGAGKSTLLKIIAGVLMPTSGTVRVNGNIAPMLELGAGFDQDLTARENIYLNGAILGYSKAFLQSKFDEIIDFAELDGFVDQPIRTFSSGMMMRLAFSVATLVEPEVLIVDEILSVGDRHFQRKSEERMRQLMSGGTTVLMVSHSLAQIRSLCNHVLWLDHGKVVMDGDTTTVCDAYEGLIDFDNMPKFEIGCNMDDLQRLNMYHDNWLPASGSYKIKTGRMGIISGVLRCPFKDLKGHEKLTLFLDETPDEKMQMIPVDQEFIKFELRGKPDTVVTVHVESNFSRSSEMDPRKLSVVLEETRGI